MKSFVLIGRANLISASDPSEGECDLTKFDRTIKFRLRAQRGARRSSITAKRTGEQLAREVDIDYRRR